jgi:glutaredoxin
MITIYGNQTCNWCKRAVELVKEKNLDYVYKDVDIDENYNELKNKLSFVKSIPQIWWDEKHVGGYEALTEEINTRN